MRTFLAVYIADLPEQQNVAGVTSGYAPSSTAGPTTLGSPTPHPLRRGKDTLDAIRAINEEIEALGAQGDLERYRKIAKAYGLNGVDLLFWRNWLWAEPPFFLAPDALHQLHKLFIDHLVDWARCMMLFINLMNCLLIIWLIGQGSYSGQKSLTADYPCSSLVLVLNILGVAFFDISSILAPRLKT